MAANPTLIDPTKLPRPLGPLISESIHLEAVKQLWLHAGVIMSNRPEFFLEYTDHSIQHVFETLETAIKLIPEPLRKRPADVLTPDDAACLTSATLLHDLGMHITEKGFFELISRDWNQPKSRYMPDDKPWAESWRAYAREAVRFDDRKLLRLLGPDDVRHKDSLAQLGDIEKRMGNLNNAEKRAIGEFLRRHHPRLAHELALAGMPGADGTFTVLANKMGETFADLCGFVARSHGMDLRHSVDALNALHPRHKRQQGVIAPFHMALLRVADYLQLQSARAPIVLYHLKDIQSPNSIHEWKKHRAVKSLTWGQTTDDRAVDVVIDFSPVPPVEVHTLTTHIALRTLLRDVQRELDTSAGVLRECFSQCKPPLNAVELSISRVTTNLDDNTSTARLPYEPKHAAFTTGGPELLRLLIRPLYGDNVPEVGIRELMQNAIDAVRELKDLAEHDPSRPDPDERAKFYKNLKRWDLGKDEQGREIDVLISLDQAKDGKWWCRCVDRGVGMSPDTVRAYFLKAGASYRTSAEWKALHLRDDKSSRIARAGRFGIGAFAMFLLCDPNDDEQKIVVRTRHGNAMRGIKFEAGLDTDPIAFVWDDTAPIGTDILVPMDDESVHRLLKAEDLASLSRPWDKTSGWDWYLGNDVNVVRRIGHTSLPQRCCFPCSSKGSPPPGWKQIRDRHGRVVSWTWRSLLSSPLPRIVCNGIRVGDWISASDPKAGRGGMLFCTSEDGGGPPIPLSVTRDIVLIKSIEHLFPRTTIDSHYDQIAIAMAYQFRASFNADWWLEFAVAGRCLAPLSDRPVVINNNGWMPIGVYDNIKDNDKYLINCHSHVFATPSGLKKDDFWVSLISNFSLVSADQNLLRPCDIDFFPRDRYDTRVPSGTLVPNASGHNIYASMRGTTVIPRDVLTLLNMAGCSFASIPSARPSEFHLSLFDRGTKINATPKAYDRIWVRLLGANKMPWDMSQREELLRSRKTEIKKVCPDFLERVDFWKRVLGAGWTPEEGWPKGKDLSCIAPKA